MIDSRSPQPNATPTEQLPSRPMRSLRSTLPVAAVLLSASACMSYVPAELNEVRPAQKVRLTVDEAQLGRLAAFANGVTRSVDGEFLGFEGQASRVIVRTPTAFQEVLIPNSSILGTQIRRPDNKKNFLISAVSVGGIGLLAWKGFTGGGNRGPTVGPVADEAVVPLYGVTLPGGLTLRFGSR